jgi:hypothetical protein
VITVRLLGSNTMETCEIINLLGSKSMATGKIMNASLSGWLICLHFAVLSTRAWIARLTIDADILREIVCLLTQRVRAGRATFLIKVKSHLGEPINKRADTLAEEGREISDDDKRPNGSDDV